MSAGLARQKSVRSRRAPLTFSSVRAAARDLAVTAIDAKVLNNCETLPELHAAARDGQLEAVHALLANRADVNEVYSIPCEEHTSGWAPLHIASFKGHSSVVAALLGRIEEGLKEERRPDANLTHALNTQDCFGRTALHMAASSDDPETVKLLLDKGARWDTKDERRLTPLYYGIQSGLIEVVRTFLGHLHTTNWDGLGAELDRYCLEYYLPFKGHAEVDLGLFRVMTSLCMRLQYPTRGWRCGLSQFLYQATLDSPELGLACGLFMSYRGAPLSAMLSTYSELKFGSAVCKFTDPHVADDLLELGSLSATIAIALEAVWLQLYPLYMKLLVDAPATSAKVQNGRLHRVVEVAILVPCKPFLSSAATQNYSTTKWRGRGSLVFEVDMFCTIMFLLLTTQLRQADSPVYAQAATARPVFAILVGSPTIALLTAVSFRIARQFYIAVVNDLWHNGSGNNNRTLSEAIEDIFDYLSKIACQKKVNELVSRTWAPCVRVLCFLIPAPLALLGWYWFISHVLLENELSHFIRPAPADIELVLLVWQFGFVVMEVQELALGWTTTIDTLKRHFSGWNNLDTLTHSITLASLAWRQAWRVLPDFPSTSDVTVYGTDEVRALMTLGIGLSWLRLLRVLEIHHRLGPLLAMVISMVCKDLVEFICLAALLLLACSEGLRFLFRESTDAAAAKHNSVIMSLRTIFTVLIEGGSLDTYYEYAGSSNHTIPVSFAWVAMAIVEVGIALVLINLLIAMFSKSFDDINENQTLEYLATRSTRIEEWDSAPFFRPPFNLFILPAQLVWTRTHRHCTRPKQGTQTISGDGHLFTGEMIGSHRNPKILIADHRTAIAIKLNSPSTGDQPHPAQQQMLTMDLVKGAKKFFQEKAFVHEPEAPILFFVIEYVRLTRLRQELSNGSIVYDEDLSKVIGPKQEPIHAGSTAKTTSSDNSPHRFSSALDEKDGGDDDDNDDDARSETREQELTKSQFSEGLKWLEEHILLKADPETLVSARTQLQELSLALEDARAQAELDAQPQAVCSTDVHSADAAQGEAQQKVHQLEKKHRALRHSMADSLGACEVLVRFWLGLRVVQRILEQAHDDEEDDTWRKGMKKRLIRLNGKTDRSVNKTLRGFQETTKTLGDLEAKIDGFDSKLEAMLRHLDHYRDSAASTGHATQPATLERPSEATTTMEEIWC